MTVSTFSSVNQSAATMSAAVNVLRAALVAAGWTQAGSGDGTTFDNAAAGPVNSGGSGVGGLDGTGRWVRLRDPAGVREIIFFRGANSQTWSLVYSYSARFTGGSPGAAARPTATDEVTVVNARTFSTSSPSYAHAIVEDTAINGVYGFWLLRTVQGTSARQDLLACDPLSSVADQSRYATIGTAIDPCVWLCAPNTATPGFSMTNPSTTVDVQWLLSPTLSTRALSGLQVARWGTGNGSGNTMADGTSAPNGMGANDYDGGDDLCAMLYCRFAAVPNGYLVGLSHHMSLKTVAARQYPDVVQHGSSDLAWVYYGTLAVPWPKGTAPSA